MVIGIFQNIFQTWAIIFSQRSKGRILDELRVSFNKKSNHLIKNQTTAETDGIKVNTAIGHRGNIDKKNQAMQNGTNQSRIKAQIESRKRQVCLGMCDLLVDTRH